MQQRRTIAKDEGVMLGKPTVAGTRLTVELILEKLAAGEGVGLIVESYPRLNRDSVREALLFAAERVEEVLTRLELADGPLADAATALDDHYAEDERIEAPPRRLLPDEAEPPALLSVADKVSPADVPREQAIQAMQELKGRDVPRLLEAVAEAARTKEAGLEWRGPSQDAWAESAVALAFASEVLRIFRWITSRPRLRILADESVEGEIVALLRGEGHDVAYVPEISAGIRDDEVLAQANAEDRVLLTEDKDFSDLAFIYGSRSAGIILLRAHGAGTETKADLVAEVLEAHGAELTEDPPQFVVVRPGRPPRYRPIGGIGTGG